MKMVKAIVGCYYPKVSIIECPEDIANNLHAYLLEFDKYEHPACWGTEEFVDYLNKIVLKDRNEKITILELATTEYDETWPRVDY